LTSPSFELVLDIDPEDVADRALLLGAGWSLADPSTVAEPHAYRSYVQRSRAEICVAKEMYVRSSSGWVSDRSACYLASGKPVVAQNTGFGHTLPVGEGLLAFDDIEGAAAAVDEVHRNYEFHSRAARALAEQYFDSDRVLGDLIERLDLA
jgi:glycosyltransferase involved in cell wall biosynthesis